MRLLLTLGDPHGIGPEIALCAALDADLRREADLVLIGAASAVRAHAEAMGLRDLGVTVLDDPEAPMPRDGVAVLDPLPGDEAPPVDFGKPSAESGRRAMEAVRLATDLCLDGRADAMVTAPLSKEAIAQANYPYPGHTEFLAERCATDRFTMMMVDVASTLRVGLVSAHDALADVPSKITRAAILAKLRIVDEAVRRDFGIAQPRIAVLGLNPHAGDGGVMGREEIETIAPALEAAAAEGLHIEGPLPADGFFGTQRADFDACLAMYHDQGLAPFKALAFDTGVNFTAGLPIVRTSPDHGTAFGLAGQGRARPESMVSAVRLALEVVRRRADA